MLDGKVKTLHPKIHAAIITAEIGIVAVNLIPLHPNSIENMDIGGVALLRSAIKNFENVSVIVNPGRYDEIVKELRKEGNILYETKLNLAIEASEYILGYELKINELLKGKRE
jgi:phosphoribosylaminoimidazolecarboxamide formyltransferase/IMP cyclohydrolase